MREQLIKFSRNGIEASLILIAVLVPLMLFPFVSQGGVFEFGKQMVLYGLLSIAGFLWVGKMFLEKRVEITRSRLDLPLFLFCCIVCSCDIFFT